jgi:hypothetical protein
MLTQNLPCTTASVILESGTLSALHLEQMNNGVKDLSNNFKTTDELVCI